MRYLLPIGLLTVGGAFLWFSSQLPGGPDPASAVNNLVSIFMLVSGVVCILLGGVTFFLRHDEDIW